MPFTVQDLVTDGTVTAGQSLPSSRSVWAPIAMHLYYYLASKSHTMPQSSARESLHLELSSDRTGTPSNMQAFSELVAWWAEFEQAQFSEGQMTAGLRGVIAEIDAGRPVSLPRELNQLAARVERHTLEQQTEDIEAWAKALAERIADRND